MRLFPAVALTIMSIAAAEAAAQPYDFSAADLLLNDELPNMNGNVAVIVRQGEIDLYRFQAGAIDYGTKNRLASFTKTISAGVILSLLDDGTMSPAERLGDAFPLFEQNDIGDATVLDCWAMRHGVTTPIPYHRDARFTLAQSVALIGVNGSQSFLPGTRLGYDGLGMQTTGLIAVQREAAEWVDIARARIFDRCGMPEADYLQFDPNPAIAGGLRSSAIETMNYAQMIIDRGMYADERVLSEAAVEQLFTNNTRGLPVEASPWPERDPGYPYGVDPDYAFGGWVLAEHPETQHVEEIIGAGAWGSFIWIDRRRGLTAVLITDITPTTQASRDAALGLFTMARDAVEAAQATSLAVGRKGDEVRLSWQPAAGSIGSRVYGAAAPLRDVFDLADAPFVIEIEGGEALVPPFASYAVTSIFEELENTALVPGGNVLDRPEPCGPDVDESGGVGFGDLLVVLAAWGPCDACLGDIDASGVVDFDDLLRVLSAWGPCA